MLGIAVSALRGSAASVGTGIAAFAVVLQFFSGVFFAFPELPSWMQQVAALLPLKWLTQGMRSVFLPDEAAAAEVAGSWEHGRTALVLVGMGDHRRRGVRADVPLASGRRMTSGRRAAGRRRPLLREDVDGDRPLSPRGWQFTLIGLHAVFAVLLGIAVATIALAPIDGSKALLLSALAALALAYVFLGAPALSSRDQSARPGLPGRPRGRVRCAGLG